MKIRKVGVVGCGNMGSQYTQSCAQAGYEVIASEVSDSQLSKGLAAIESRLRADVEKGRLSLQDKASIMSRITPTTDIEEFAECDIVVENVTEKMDLKKKVFADLDEVCPEHAVLAANTSGLSIIDMAMATKKPDKVLGLHSGPLTAPFMEIIKTVATSDETLEIGKGFSKSLGMTFVIAPDIPGFVLNRLYFAFLLTAVRMVEAGITTPQDIDTIFTKCFNHRVGPLTQLDIAGLDNSLDVASGIYEQLKDPLYAPPTLLRKMVAAGWLGCKTGKGFYEYSEVGKE